ncbi:integrase [Streptomyces sp. SBT349]|uniref:integrase n=1 Tax=Streptomyces sp. SBT349 TaxID=1580539 RepID=UPI001F271024|nr:integrase [Streptomyces sp. SBT349]
MTLLAREPCTFQAVEVRTALREYAFNRNRREAAPPEAAAILRWVKRNTPTMAVWEDADGVEDLLEALDTKLDGTPVAASTVKRNRRILNVMVQYAIRRGVLRARGPVPKPPQRWTSGA